MICNISDMWSPKGLQPTSWAELEHYLFKPVGKLEWDKWSEMSNVPKFSLMKPDLTGNNCQHTY